MEPGGVEDVDTVRRGGDQPGQPEVAQYSRHHFTDRADSIRKLLLRHLGNELAARAC